MNLDPLKEQEDLLNNGHLSSSWAFFVLFCQFQLFKKKTLCMCVCVLPECVRVYHVPLEMSRGHCILCDEGYNR